MSRKQNFWEVDLIELGRSWLSQFKVFFMTILAFVEMGLPLFIAVFIVWAMAGFPRLTI